MTLPLDPLPLEVVPFDFDGLIKCLLLNLLGQLAQALQKIPDVALQAVEVVVAKAGTCRGPT